MTTPAAPAGAGASSAAFASLSNDEQVARLRDLAVAALGRWGLAQADVSLVKYRENAVFRVAADASGATMPGSMPGDRPGAVRGVMRVHRPRYRSDLDIACELAWMRHLAAAGIATPAAIPSADGAFVVTVAAPGVPEPRQCDLLEWVDGAPPGTLEGGVAASDAEVRALYASVGELAARMHDLAAAWDRPEPFSRPSWNLETLVGESPTFGRFDDLDCLSPGQLDVFRRARDVVRRRLAELGPADALIHGDLVPDNILVDGDLRRVIDFDDFGWSWAGFEMATSLWPLQVSGGFDAGLEGFLEGYRGVRAFPAHELEALPDLLMARSLSYLGWTTARPEIESVRELTPMFAVMLADAASDYLAARA